MEEQGAPGIRREAEDPSCSPERLLELSADDRFFVRRAAEAHPRLPTGTIELWIRAGSTADLAAFGAVDPTLPAGELERLSLLGPWGARLAARHPATAAATLARLASHSSASVRADVASHTCTPPECLAALLLDADETVRARAAAHPLASRDLVVLLERAADLEAGLSEAELVHLESAGGAGRLLLARRPEISAETCARLAADPDPEVRRAVWAHARLPAEALAAAVREEPDDPALLGLAAAQPAASPELLRWLVLHGPAAVRVAAGAHPRFPAAERERLTRAGASLDLAGFAPPDPSLESAALSELADAGAWARLLTARHPATPAQDLERLVTDGDPLVRQAAAAHPRRPAELLALLKAAGSTAELDGLERSEAQPLAPASLERLARLGPWARRLAARHREASSALLDQLSLDGEAQIRAEVAAHGATAPNTLLTLAADLSPQVRWAVARRPDLSPECLAELAKSPEATIRAQVATHPACPESLRSRLGRDPDEGVRAAASEERLTGIRSEV